MKKKSAKKKAKKRAAHYEPKLAINATLDEVLKISGQPDIKPEKKK